MISIADLRAHCRSRSSDDDYVTALETEAVAYVQNQTGRYFGPSDEVTEHIVGMGHKRLWLSEEPLSGSEPSTVAERVVPGGDPSTITASDDSGFLVRGNKLVRKGGFVWGFGYEYEVSYNRGYASGDEPGDIRRAVKEIVSHWYERRVPVSKAAMSEVPLSAASTIRRWKRLHRQVGP